MNPREKSVVNFFIGSDYVLLNDGSITRVSPVFNHKNAALDFTIINKMFEFDLTWKVSEEQYGNR